MVFLGPLCLDNDLGSLEVVELRRHIQPLSNHNDVGNRNCSENERVLVKQVVDDIY